MAVTWLGIAVVVLLILAGANGYRRGFIKEAVSMFCVVLSMAVVWFVNPYVNEFIRQNTPVYETVRETCREFVGEKTQGQMTDERAVLENLELPELVTEGMVKNNTAEVYQYLAVSTFGDYISEYLAVTAVNSLSFLISFLLATLMIRIITGALNLISRLPVINGLNRIAGIVVSAAKYLVFIWVAMLLVTVLCNTDLGAKALEMIKGDVILSFLYDQNILIRVFASIFYGAG